MACSVEDLCLQMLIDRQRIDLFGLLSQFRSALKSPSGVEGIDTGYGSLIYSFGIIVVSLILLSGLLSLSLQCGIGKAEFVVALIPVSQCQITGSCRGKTRDIFVDIGLVVGAVGLLSGKNQHQCSLLLLGRESRTDGGSLERRVRE